jgi:hypothetical protein
MKRLYFVALAMGLSIASIAQKRGGHLSSIEDTTVTTGVSLGWYAAAGLSLSNGDGFANIAYPSVEVGVSRNNMSYGLNFGRRDLADHGETEVPENYYLEGKASASWPLGDVKTFVMGGFGFVFNTDHYLIEYGTGLIWPCSSNTDLVLQISNWDKSDYVSVGVVRNF